MIYTVYKHTSPSGKVYIGITSKDNPKLRWQNGLGYRGNRHFTAAIKKYGWENIKHEILFSGLTKEEAEAKEIELIAFYHSNDRQYGYNIDNGGSCVGKCSDETKKKISEALMGKTHSKEKGMKIGLAQLGNKRALGSKRTLEQKQKLSNALKGKKHSAEHNRRMGIAHMHPVLCIETKVIYPSVKAASEGTGINKNCISHACNGRNKSAGGFHWQFVNVRYTA